MIRQKKQGWKRDYHIQIFLLTRLSRGATETMNTRGMVVRALIKPYGLWRGGDISIRTPINGGWRELPLLNIRRTPAIECLTLGTTILISIYSSD